MTSSGLLGELAVVPPAHTGKMIKSDVPMKNKTTFALYLLFMGAGIAGLFFFKSRRLPDSHDFYAGYFEWLDGLVF